MAVFGIILMLAGALLLGLAYLSSQARPSEGEEASARLEEAIANTSEITGQYAKAYEYRERIRDRQETAARAEKAQQTRLIIGAAAFIAGAVLFGTGRRPVAAT